MIDPSNPDFNFTPVSSDRPSFGYLAKSSSVQPCVTLVTPFYNTGEIFHETARSVLGQSLQEWAWLIVNDASDDPQSLAILAEYRSKDARIRVIDLEQNSGPSTARNLAIRMAQTEYIALLDSDDMLEPTTLEKWFWFLVSYPEFGFVRGYTVGFGAQKYLWKLGYHTPNEFLRDNQIDSASMMRKSVHEKVGGYDESERLGLEDWEFWMHCANEGIWGDTIPEYHNWYRRRENHSERWKNWDYGEKQAAFRNRLKQRYPRLWQDGMPGISRRGTIPNDSVPDELPSRNLLRKEKPRLLIIAPWMTTGGADKFNLDLIKQLTRRGWEISIATTVLAENHWLPQFARTTPDIFILDNFLHLTDQPRFLRYLIASRQMDVVMVTNSEMGYHLLPYLRSHFPELTLIDFCHIEEEYWKNGGYPRMAIEYQKFLDRNIVASKHVKDWMVARGGDASRIDVCYINIDPVEWHPDPERRTIVRRELNVSNDVPLILFAGRILPQKQPEVLAKTMLSLTNLGVQFMAVIAGDGPDLEWLRAYIKKHNLQGCVQLLGVVSNQRIKELMNAADIFFLPSKWEGIALVIYEAMACGLPVVGADVGGQRELLTPECGVLVNPGDEDNQVRDYCNALADLAQNSEKRWSMGAEGRKRVSTHFSLDRMGEQMVALIETAKQEHKRQPLPVVDPHLGRTVATQAVEYARLTRFADWLWAERGKPLLSGEQQGGLRLREKIYARLYRWHEPIYRWYSKRGFGWLAPLRDGIKRALIR